MTKKQNSKPYDLKDRTFAFAKSELPTQGRTDALVDSSLMLLNPPYDFRLPT